MRIALFIEDGGPLARETADRALGSMTERIDIIELTGDSDVSGMLGLLDETTHSVVLAIDPWNRNLAGTLEGLGQFSVEYHPQNIEGLPHLGADAVFRGLGATGLKQVIQLIDQRIARQA